jgi:hypothetical protein
MATKPDLRELFAHVDAALHLLAKASGELGTAGTAAHADAVQSPMAIFAPIKRFFSTRKASKLLSQARPHLEAIKRSYVESKEWLVTAPQPDAWMGAVLELAGSGIVETVLDGMIHDRIETQLLELNALLDEIGRLHLRLRTADPTLVTSVA